MKRFCTLLIALLWTPLVLMAQDNLITNGSFSDWSDGKPTGWNVPSQFSPQQANEHPNGGAPYSLKITLGGSGLISLPLKGANGIKPGNRYRLSYWYKGHSNNKVMVFWIKWDPNSSYDKITDETVSPQDQWQEKSFDFTAPRNASDTKINLIIMGAGATGTLYLDEVSLVDISNKASEPIKIDDKDKLGNNLLSNPGMEDWPSSGRLSGWYLPNSLAASQETSIVKSGKSALKLYPTGTSMTTSKEIPVRPGKTYILSYWYRGRSSVRNIKPVLTWYAGSTKSTAQPTDLSQYEVRPDPERWIQQLIRVVVPKEGNITSASLELFFTNDPEGGLLYLDEFVMAEIKDGSEPDLPQLPKATNLSATPHQREVELSWQGEQEGDIKWEVFLRDKTYATTASKTLLITGLTPGQTYSVKVRASKEGQSGSFSEPIEVQTRPLGYDVASPERIPYLRTLGTTRDCSDTIDLFFEDLASDQAKITYYFDNKPLTPQGYQLKLPEKGEHTLIVTIDEGSDRVWTLEYLLNVK